MASGSAAAEMIFVREGIRIYANIEQVHAPRVLVNASCTPMLEGAFQPGNPVSLMAVHENNTFLVRTVVDRYDSSRLLLRMLEAPRPITFRKDKRYDHKAPLMYRSLDGSNSGGWKNAEGLDISLGGLRLKLRPNTRTFSRAELLLNLPPVCTKVGEASTAASMRITRSEGESDGRVNTTARAIAETTYTNLDRHGSIIMGMRFSSMTPMLKLRLIRLIEDISGEIIEPQTDALFGEKWV